METRVLFQEKLLDQSLNRRHGLDGALLVDSGNSASRRIDGGNIPQAGGIFPPSPSPSSTPERMCVYSFFTHPLRGLLLRDNFFAKVNHGFPKPLAAQHGQGSCLAENV
ncbi:jg19382 [Pararge aegeria aegeria]|uniref:Jg19382 protein n=1 Tax=Pararge aegeria aegeria TaxID=348720 RepID=A0A8S4RAR6_9NEOP|nr:jg19382 [Pararge aegeria aegeria]